MAAPPLRPGSPLPGFKMAAPLPRALPRAPAPSRALLRARAAPPHFRLCSSHFVFPPPLLPELLPPSCRRGPRHSSSPPGAAPAGPGPIPIPLPLSREAPPQPGRGGGCRAMSSEESYLAILRYLTNEREPYAPGTEGNAKRKIRKAAACYVVRGGTLYYQRRQRDQQRFAELEVVLQAERRARLIRAAHLAPDGAHRTRLQTWQGLSQKYWWRGERLGGGGRWAPSHRSAAGRERGGSQGHPRARGTGPRPGGS